MDALPLFRRVENDFANREVRLLLPRAIADQRRAARAFPPGQGLRRARGIGSMRRDDGGDQ